MNCNSCGAPLKHPGAKFCSKCGAKQTIDETPLEAGVSNTTPRKDMSVVKQRIYWNIKPGEIACRINEAEFINYNSMLGLIINEGTTAYIRANGHTIAEIHGGNYDFVNPEEVNQLLETRVGGLASAIKRGYRAIVNLILGKRIKDQFVNDESETTKLRSLDEAIKYMQKNELLSITLKQDREFQLIFGESHDDLDEFKEFVPIKIRTKYHDILVGIRAFFQIEDFNAFASFYLNESATVRTNMLAKMLTPLIKATVKDHLADVEMTDTRVSQEICSQVEARLKSMDFHGIRLKSIVEISADNEDLERMNALTKELYLSEQELDYLRRTNDFKNRLNTVIAQQQITEAQNEQELYLRLQEINKDKLIAEEELRKFYIVLSREGRIFNAQSTLTETEAIDKVNSSLHDIRKTGLLRKEELDILMFQIKEREYKRGYAVKLMQLKDAIEYEKVRTGGEQEIKLQELTNEIELVRIQDNYKDERFYKELELWNSKRNAELDNIKKQNEIQNAQTEFNYNLAERAQQAQMERYSQMERLENEMEEAAAERKRKELQLQQEHEYRIRQEQERTIREREHAHQNMSAEQIAAQRLAEMSDKAQEEYFRSLSAGKDIEQERKLREEQKEFLKQQNDSIQRVSAQSMETMQNMMQSMMGTMATMSGNMVQSRNEQKEEYREELHRQQNRHDMHQDQALNYTTRQPQSNMIVVSADAKKNETSVNTQPILQQAAPKHARNIDGDGDDEECKECPICHRKYNKDDNFCDNCGCFI